MQIWKNIQKLNGPNDHYLSWKDEWKKRSKKIDFFEDNQVILKQIFFILRGEFILES
jgi:hypothetical protein